MTSVDFFSNDRESRPVTQFLNSLMLWQSAINDCSNCKQLRNQIVENKSVQYSSSWFSFHKVYSWKYYYTLWVGCLTIAEYPSAFPRVSLSYCWYSFTCIPLEEESEVSCPGLKHGRQVKALPPDLLTWEFSMLNIELLPLCFEYHLNDKVIYSFLV